MDTKNYTDILLSLSTLDRFQLRHLVVRAEEALEKDDVNCAIEKRAEKLKCCPHCQSQRLVRWGRASGMQRYRCHACKRTFNELSGTPLARLRKRSQLALYAQCLTEGVSLRVAAKRCHINLATSFRWRHRFLKLPEQHKATGLAGIVEVDEAFFRESYKGKRNIHHRQARHHGRVPKGQKVDLVPVLILLDRYNREADFVLGSASCDEVSPCIKTHVKPGAVLCSDGSSLYPSVSEEHGLYHKRILSDNPERSIDGGIFHIQTLNNYIARLRTWMRRFNGVGTDYLGNYLGWWRMTQGGDIETRRDWLNEALST